MSPERLAEIRQQAADKFPFWSAMRDLLIEVRVLREQVEGAKASAQQQYERANTYMEAVDTLTEQVIRLRTALEEIGARAESITVLAQYRDTEAADIASAVRVVLHA